MVERYTIWGHYVGGVLGRRLSETAVTGINELPGVVVHTKEGAYYSELCRLPASRLEPIPRKDLTEETQGLVELTTKEMADKGRRKFEVGRKI